MLRVILPHILLGVAILVIGTAVAIWLV